MAKRYAAKFSKQPKIPVTAKLGHSSSAESIIGIFDMFKCIYVLERRIAEKIRGGGGNYCPAKSLSGVAKFMGPEAKVPVNQWQRQYRRLQNNTSDVSPEEFIRILFHVIRESALPVPTVPQLSSSSSQQLVAEYLKDLPRKLYFNLNSEKQRATLEIKLQLKAYNRPLDQAVLHAISNSNLDLSALFKYCLIHSTLKDIQEGEGILTENLHKVLKQFEFLAAVEYTVTPEAYDAAWQSIIPPDFNHKANKKWLAALNQSCSALS